MRNSSARGLGARVYWHVNAIKDWEVLQQGAELISKMSGQQSYTASDRHLQAMSPCFECPEAPQSGNALQRKPRFALESLQKRLQ